MYKDLVRILLAQGNSDNRDALLIHGTNTEAIKILAATGFLPTSVNYDPYANSKAHSTSKGYLYFCPLPWKFPEDMRHIFRKFHKSLKGYENELARSYAHMSQMVLIGTRLLGRPYCYEAELDILERDHEDSLIKTIRKKYCPRGVVLGVNEKILEKKVEPGEDEGSFEAMVHLPDGLSIEFISYIRPMGTLEQDELRSFFN